MLKFTRENVVGIKKNIKHNQDQNNSNYNNIPKYNILN